VREKKSKRQDHKGGRDAQQVGASRVSKTTKSRDRTRRKRVQGRGDQAEQHGGGDLAPGRQRPVDKGKEPCVGGRGGILKQKIPEGKIRRRLAKAPRPPPVLLGFKNTHQFKKRTLEKGKAKTAKKTARNMRSGPEGRTTSEKP